MSKELLCGKAYAKVNLSLDILSKMDDGYHYLETVMQSVDLCDEITMKRTSGTGIAVNTSLPYIPKDERNVAIKAAKIFFEHTGLEVCGISINIKKKIPVCAGLGGGSSDAACVLRMLDEMFDTKLGSKQLEKLGSSIGSDVPFCISGGTQLAKGKGEILTPLPPIPRCSIVICKPPFSCSTPMLYNRIKCKEIRTRPDTEGLVKSVESGDLGGVARRMYNVFEDVLPHGRSDIEAIKGELLDCGALGTVMTGSGPAVFGIFSNADYAKQAHGKLSGMYKDCYITNS